MPLDPVPRNQSSRGIQTRHSVTCQASSTRQDGRASTASGSSQSEYCGLQTLLVSRNAATTRNSSCGSRGRRGAISPSTNTAASASSTATAATPLTCGAGLLPPRIWAKPYQRESKSAGRSRFSLRKRSQESGQSASTGRLTRHQATSAPTAARPNAGSCRDRQHSASSGTKNSSG
jgi:hypothetical protein